MGHEELTFLRERAVQHREVASKSTNKAAAKVHREMADRYERKLQEELLSTLQN